MFDVWTIPFHRRRISIKVTIFASCHIIWIQQFGCKMCLADEWCKLNEYMFLFYLFFSLSLSNTLYGLSLALSLFQPCNCSLFFFSSLNACVCFYLFHSFIFHNVHVCFCVRIKWTVYSSWWDSNTVKHWIGIWAIDNEADNESLGGANPSVKHDTDNDII